MGFYTLYCHLSLLLLLWSTDVFGKMGIGSMYAAIALKNQMVHLVYEPGYEPEAIHKL